jgi:lipoprotein-releasing system permease protein
MFSTFEWFIAYRYLRSRKREGFISLASSFALIGIALGVAALIVVMAVMNGFRSELADKIVGFNGDIEIYSLDGEINFYENLSRDIGNFDFITNVFPVINKQVLVSSKTGSFGAQVRGMKLQDLEKKTIISKNIMAGDLDKFVGNNIIIGKYLAESLGVDVGNTIKLISPQSSSTVLGRMPRFRTCKVIAIFQSGMSEYDSVFIYMPLEEAQLYFKLLKKINMFEVVTDNPNESYQHAAELSSLFPGNYRVLDWQTKNSNLFNALKTERIVMFIILGLIIVVAAFNIISSLVMLVKDKTSDIAILRTIGASRRMIITIFFICGSTLGIIGTLCGVVLGIGFAANINTIKTFLESVTGTTIFDPLVYFLSVLPSETRAEDVLRVIGLSLTLSFVATIYPALKASKLDPGKVLREK